MIYSISNKLPRQDITKNEEEYYSSLKKYADKPRLYALFQILTKLINDLKYSDFARYVFEFAVIKASNISSIINILEDKNNVPLSTAPKMQAQPNNAAVSAEINKPVINKPVINKSVINNQEIKEETVNNIKGSDNGIWTRILNIVSSKYPMLYGMLQYAKLVKDTDEHLVITFPQDRQFQYRQLKTGNLKDTFENTVWNVSEKHTKIDIELEKTEEDSKKKADIEDTLEKKNYKIDNTAQVKKVQSDKIESFAVHKMKEEVKDNSFLKMAEKELGGRIINIEKN